MRWLQLQILLYRVYWQVLCKQVCVNGIRREEGEKKESDIDVCVYGKIRDYLLLLIECSSVLRLVRRILANDASDTQETLSIPMSLAMFLCLTSRTIRDAIYRMQYNYM